MADHAGLDNFGRQVDDRSHYVSRIECLPDRSAGVDALEMEIGEFARANLKIPPGNSVLRADHDRVFVKQRLESAARAGQAVRLHAEEDYVYRTGIFELLDNARIALRNRLRR